jgi:hypothetical protein
MIIQLARHIDKMYARTAHTPEVEEPVTEGGKYLKNIL